MTESATLVLEDATILQGEAFGAPADAVFELVFNTSMTGYQEILSDPSYRGQGVVLTTSQVGNTGINLEDGESSKPQVSALVLRSLSPMISSWRASCSLPEWLAQNGVPGISEVDTRFLTRRLRDKGVMKAALSTCGTPPEQLLQASRDWPGLDGRDTVQEVTCPEPYHWQGDPGSAWMERDVRSFTRPAPHIVAYDFGTKHGILRHLSAWGMRVTVVPAATSCADAMALRPDGILLSNGPGDPAGLPGIIATVRDLIQTGLPIFGICLGHQLIGRAVGGKTVKLKFGHHAANHPVKDLLTGRVLITSQNHNYAVEAGSLDSAAIEVTHLSLNDGTVEGMHLKEYPVFSVQFHPEASPGPHDAHGCFAQFRRLLESR